MAGGYRVALIGELLSQPTKSGAKPRRSTLMGLVVLLLILALLFGGAGLFIEGLKWLIIIALVLFVASFFTGYRGRRVV